MNTNNYNKTDIVEIQDGFKYLPKYIMVQCELRRLAKEGKLETCELVDSINKFDVTYAYSDQASTWRAGEAGFKALNERIDESEYSDEDKAILKGGLLHNEASLETFADRFPITKLRTGTFDNICDLINAGQYDEVRLERILGKLSMLRDLINSTGKYVNDSLVWTKHAPKYVYKTNVKCSLSAVNHALLQEAIVGLTKADITFFNTVSLAFSTYLNIGYGNNPNYTQVTTLPYVGRIQIDNSGSHDLGEHTVYSSTLNSSKDGFEWRDDNVTIRFFTKDNLEVFFKLVENNRKKKVKKQQKFNESKLDVASAVDKLQSKFS